MTTPVAGISQLSDGQTFRQRLLCDFTGHAGESLDRPHTDVEVPIEEPIEDQSLGGDRPTERTGPWNWP